MQPPDKEICSDPLGPYRSPANAHKHLYFVPQYALETPNPIARSGMAMLAFTLAPENPESSSSATAMSIALPSRGTSRHLPSRRR